MTPRLCLATWLLALSAALSAADPVRVIYETDMSGDCDDAGALALLHTLADRGECQILGVVINDPNAASPACVDAINTWYGRGDLPIGIMPETGGGGHGYPAVVRDQFPHDLDWRSAPMAVDLYRQLLAAAPDRSVKIVSVGFLTNLARLMTSAPDAHSPLDGMDLIRAKVSELVCMGGKFPSGWEYNLAHRDRPAAEEVVTNWPVRVIYSGFEIGDGIQTGPRLWTETPAENPVRKAYEIYLGWTSTSQRSRSSWDQTAAYYAVRGGDGLWRIEDQGSNTYDIGTGHNAWVGSPDPSGEQEQGYFINLVSDGTIANVIEDLMVAAPLLGDPVANFETSVDGLTVAVDAAGSHAGDDAIVGYAWSWGDGSSGSGVQTSHRYAEPGIYQLSLEVTDDDGQVGSATRTISVSDGQPNNQPDPMLNLALLATAELSGTAGADGRGSPLDICFDPARGDYARSTPWNEYGVAFGRNLGRPAAGAGFHWQVAWPVPKRVNYLTFGGTYPNQPQPDTRWRISYRVDGSWTTLIEGQGGWIDSGIFEWGGPAQQPLTMDALKVEAFSDGSHDLVSIHLRARGGRSGGADDSATEPKACLVQLLGDWDEQPEPPAGDGPIAHWRLDEGSGSVAADSVGDHDGSLSGSAGWTAGVEDDALAFDAGGWVAVPAAAAFDLEAMTIAGWVRFDHLDGGWRTLVEHGRWGSNWFGLFKHSSQPLIHFRWGQSGSQTMESSTPLVADRWYHIAATYDPATGEARIYLDGALDASDSGPAPTPARSALRLGANLDSGESLPGALDEVRIYDRALSAAEVAALVGSTSRPPQIGPGVVTLRGTALDPDGDAVSIEVDGLSVPVVDGEWTIDVPVIDGENVFTVIAVDAAGEASSRIITIDWGPGAPLGSG